ncbi:hypothetical protein N665_2045s0001 [Sinapis alba]|nr:hypothetical protein N665_2045s0001 [Sinapis alba]
MENLFDESEIIVYKEIIGPAIYDRYGEDIIMVEPVDFVFREDAFKTMHAYVRDFIGVIKSETSKSKPEEEACDFTVELENAMNVTIEEILIKMNIQNHSDVFQVCGQRSKKLMEKEYLQKNKIRGRIFSNPERMMQINIWIYSKYFDNIVIIYFDIYRN